MVLNLVHTLKNSGRFLKNTDFQTKKKKKTLNLQCVCACIGHGGQGKLCFVTFKVILMCTYRQKLLPQIVSLMKNRTISVSCCLQNKRTQKFMVNK